MGKGRKGYGGWKTLTNLGIKGKKEAKEMGIIQYPFGIEDKRAEKFLLQHRRTKKLAILSIKEHILQKLDVLSKSTPE